jgi:endo-1,4-beta-xylanase
VTNTASTTTNGWTVQMTLASGQTLAQLWGGVPTPNGSTISVANETYNGRLAPSASTTFGYIVNGSSAAAPTGVTCRTS